MIDKTEIPELPLYRASKKNSDDVVLGYAWEECSEIVIDSTNFGGSDSESIDPSTLAIHFPDMIDSDGNKIFASLSEDGKGGTIIEYAGQRLGTVKYKYGEFKINSLNVSVIMQLSKEVKTIGIQE